MTPEGGWVRPLLLGILNDRSRLVCRVQWYLGETAEEFVHGSCQAFLKRDMPRSHPEAGCQFLEGNEVWIQSCFLPS